MMNRFALFLLALSGFTSTTAHALQPNGCPDFVEPQVFVRQLVVSPQFDETQDLPTLRQIASGDADNFSSTRHQTPVGLTAASLKLDSRYAINITSSPDDALVCAQISQFDLGFGFDDTTVYIAREIPRGSCSYRLVLEHEMRHVTTDQQLVNVTAPYLTDVLRSALREIGTIRASSADVAQTQLRSIMNTYMNDLGQSLSRVRSKYQSAIDTPEEYARLSTSCDGDLGHMLGALQRGY